ncbi:hypothetical protein Y900_028600 [Mycolicibacterium aromaticivorans JS19b1 = JCM 16368]|uniref:Uncharacterized protein n=1 Tax=Mycolicibacterium aromaticivorans JS19b1 = JCM 16368 TaxID=1440774 RepID=A0A064CC20_9MYCO|nr:hypothetical protein Y900_028600 [Mycolicibacterium aromaticivorans JS19b1 = JCM 16368]
MGFGVWAFAGDPPATSDAPFRATMVGMVVGIVGVVLAAVSLVVALRSAPPEPKSSPAGPPSNITQVVDNGSIGTIGGTHSWELQDPKSGPR